MTSVVTEGTGTACKLSDDMPVSGKTGTTSSSYDLWFCGYTPYLTASIWTGYDDNKELAGDQVYHERLWSKIMSQINTLKKYKVKDFPIGSDIKEYDICDSSGKVAVKDRCYSTHKEYFVKGTEPKKCTYHTSNYNYKTTTKSSEDSKETKKTSKSKETTKSAETKKSEAQTEAANNTPAE